MSMYQTICEMATQFGFEPKIINEEKISRHWGYLVVGMGGSHLAVGVLKMLHPELDIISHQNYGLPRLLEAELQKRLIILSSYSGNTEEVISAYEEAGKMDLNRVVITTGGKLLKLAKNDGVAYIQMPEYGIQPRAALPLSLMSFLKIVGDEKTIGELSKLQNDFHPESLEAAGKKLAERLRGKVPIIYTSVDNEILGYIWKITFNETGKIPAFCNVIPELNHNEINGFDGGGAASKLSSNFYFLMLADPDDQAKNQQRMKITAKLYADGGLLVENIVLDRENRYLKIFNAVALVGFVAYFSAIDYGLEAEQVPMVEELKKML